MKKSFLKIAFLIIGVCLTLLLLHSCAVSGLSAEPMTFRNNHSENGLVVGSISFTNEKPKFNSYFTYFHCIDSVKKISKANSRELQISPEQTWKARHSGELNNGKTYLFAFERAPGKYEVSYIRQATVGLGGATWDESISNFSIPFEVKKGEITYIGEISLDEYHLLNRGNIITVKDNFDRDIQAVKIKQPRVNWDLAKKSNFEILWKY